MAEGRDDVERIHDQMLAVVAGMISGASMTEQSDERLILCDRHLNIQKRRILLRAENVRVPRAAARPQASNRELDGVGRVEFDETPHARRKRRSKYIERVQASGWFVTPEQR